MRFIADILSQTSSTIVNYLNNKLLNKEKRKVLSRHFRQKWNDDIQMNVMFYYYKPSDTIVLVGLERHPQKCVNYVADELPDEEGDEPLYYSHDGHSSSPVYQLQRLRAKMDVELKQRCFYMNTWVVLVTNANIINKIDLQDDVWAEKKTIVFDNVNNIPDSFLKESDSNSNYETVFDCANNFTMCEGFDTTDDSHPKESKVEKEEEKKIDSDEIEKMWADLIDEVFSKEDDEETENDDEENYEEGNCVKEWEFAEEKDEADTIKDEEGGMEDEADDFSYVPEMEETLRAEVFPRLRKPEQELNEMIGCEDIKKQIQRLTALTQFNKMLLKENPDAKTHKVNLHAIFQGAPGTGKTTLCKIYASLLYKAGVLSHGHIVVTSRATYIGNNFGDEERRVHQALETAKGGVLMIDEAYQLLTKHPHDPGQNVLPLMMPLLADEKMRDIAVVLCGYKEPMTKLLELNEGLASRFTHRFDFPDFTVPQLLEISKQKIATYGHHFTRQAWVMYSEMVQKAFNNRNPKTWGNARFVTNLLEEIYIQHADRCYRTSNTRQLHTITTADIKKVVLPEENLQKKIIGFR